MWLLEQEEGIRSQLSNCWQIVTLGCDLSWFNWIQWWFLNCKWLRCWWNGGNCRTEIRWTNNFINKFQYWKKSAVKISLCIVMNISQESPQLGDHAEQNCTWNIPENKVWLAVNLEFYSPAVVNISLKCNHSEPKSLGRQRAMHTHSRTQNSKRLKPLTLNLEKRRKRNTCSSCSAHVGYKKYVDARRKKLGNLEKCDGIVEREEIGGLENGGSEIRRSTCASEWASTEAASRHDLRHALVFAASSNFHSRQASDVTQPSVDVCRCEEHGSRDLPDWERRRHHVPRPGPGSPVSYPVSKRLEARGSQVRGRLGRHHDPTVPSLWHHRQRKNGEGDRRLGIGQQEEDRCCGRQSLLWQHHFTRFGVQHGSGFEVLPTHRSLWNCR